MRIRKKSKQLAEMLLIELEALKTAESTISIDNLLVLVNEILRDARGLAEETLEDSE